MGAGKVLAVLGGAVALAVGLGLWLVMSDSDTAGPTPDADKEAVATKAPGAGATADPRGTRTRGRSAGTGSVFGQVKRRTGNVDAVGQAVTLLRDGGDPWSVVTDEHGEFRLPQLPEGGPYELQVVAAGFATVRLPGISLSRGEAMDVGTLWLDLAARATVNVRSSQDEPIAGASVSAYAGVDWSRIGWDQAKAAAQMSAVPVAVSTAVTDAAGQAVFPEMASGSWTFVATKAGFAREGRSGVQLEGGSDEKNIRIILHTGHVLKGRVLGADAQPVPKTLVLASRGGQSWDSGALRIRATTDAEGRFSLSELAAGDWTLLTGMPGSIPAQAATVRIPGVTEIDLTLPLGGRYTGTVTNADGGAPVEGAVVRVTTGGRGNRTAEATSGADGRFAIDPLPDETVMSVVVEKEGFAMERDGKPQTQQTVLRGESVDVTLKVRVGGTLEGIVSGPDGVVVGARVWVYVGPKTMNMWNGFQNGPKQATTDALGKYSVTSLEPGRAVVQVTKSGLIQKDFPAQGYWAALQQQGDSPCRTDVAPGLAAKLDVTMTKGLRVSGKVEGPEGPLAGAKVSIQQSSTKSAEDGTFALDGVQPGPNTYIWAALKGYVATEQQQLVVEPDTPLENVVVKLTKQPVVRGTILSSTGAPLLDARVTATVIGTNQNQQWNWNQDGQDLGGGEPVKADGTYELPLTGAVGTATVRAVAADHAFTVSAPITLTLDRDVYEANLTLEPGTSLTGRVVIGNTGVPGARISTSTRSASEFGGRMMRSSMPWGGDGNGGSGTVVAISGADGMFTIEHAAAGKYRVDASADGYVSASKNDVKVPDSTPLTLELAPELEIDGRVLFADGSPVAGAMVAVEKAEQAAGQNQFMGYNPGGITTSADGRFRARKLAAGQYKVRVDPPWTDGANIKQKVSEPIAAGSTDVKVIVEPGATIAGHVVDSAKKAIVGCLVYAQSEGGNVWRQSQTKDDGTFELTGLSDGNYTVTAYMQSYDGTSTMRPASRQKIPANTRDLELTMEAGVTIEGVVLDAAGKPLAQIQLQAAPIMEPGEDGQNKTWGNATTGNDGKFKIGGLAAGRYTIQQADWGGNGAKQLILAGGSGVAGGSTGVTLRASKGLSISGVVVDEQGTGIPNANVMCYSPTSPGTRRNGVTDGAGRFEVAGLSEGKVNVTAYSQGRIQATLSAIDVGSNDLRITMTKGHRVAGRVTRGGKAGASLTLGFTATDGGTASWARTDEDGRFVAEGLAAGTQKVTAWIQTGAGAMEQKDVGTVNADDENVVLDIP